MTTENTLKDWDRPYFTEAGNNNILYFVVYGEPIAEFQISRKKYRFSHMPEALEIKNVNDPVEVNRFRSNLFEKFMLRDIPEQAEAIKGLNHCYLVQCELPDAPHLNDFRTVIGIVTYLLDMGCQAVFDVFALTWWSAEKWRAEVFEPEKLDYFGQVVILVSQEDDGSSWFHTRGLSKFGRPDLSIHYVKDEEQDVVKEMFNRFIGFMAGGGFIEEGREIKMEGLPQGMTCHHKGSMDDFDFNNVHVEIVWPDR